ncbi:SCLY [Symbiodinium pilosum]|uniref:SCLY protein n=1 Tax=Symbiodinium pilosum TaxID=2952 RepID=A0A812XCG5_SYMPI|nr:SCLY [Symbiodinium pilosum]
MTMFAWLWTMPWAEERKIELTENQGFAAGQTGEYFRYKHIFHKKPSDEDFQHAQQVAEEVRCVVCAKILASLLGKARSFSEDDIADVLEGNTEYERTGDQVTDQMLKHKRGCNKHFKEGRRFPIRLREQD